MNILSIDSQAENATRFYVSTGNNAMEDLSIPEIEGDNRDTNWLRISEQ